MSYRTKKDLLEEILNLRKEIGEWEDFGKFIWNKKRKKFRLGRFKAFLLEKLFLSIPLFWAKAIMEECNRPSFFNQILEKRKGEDVR